MPFLFLSNRLLLAAVQRLRSRQMSERGLVRIAVRIIDRERIALELEPGEQCFGLRMIGKAIDGYRISWIRQVFDNVAVFHDVLALSCIVLPERGDVVDPVEANERIVERFGNLVAVGSHVLEAAAEDSGADPA